MRKRDKPLLRTTTWLILTNIMVSKTNQTQNSMCSMVALYKVQNRCNEKSGLGFPWGMSW